MRATDPEKRKDIYLRMQEIMEDTGCYVWLLHEPEVYVHRDNLKLHLAPTGETQVAYFKPA
jgi:peptide/nickel transport system substrate-binding protein